MMWFDVMWCGVMHCGVMFRTIQIQGWTPDFIPLITENALAMGLVDEVLPIAGEAAIATSSRLAKEEGIFTGISGGATMATALDVAAKACDHLPPPYPPIHFGFFFV